MVLASVIDVTKVDHGACTGTNGLVSLVLQRLLALGLVGAWDSVGSGDVIAIATRASYRGVLLVIVFFVFAALQVGAGVAELLQSRLLHLQAEVTQIGVGHFVVSKELVDAVGAKGNGEESCMAKDEATEEELLDLGNLGEQAVDLVIGNWWHAVFDGGRVLDGAA